MQERRGDDVRRVIETVWQMESPKIIAALARHVGDFGTAEDLAHDALVAALEKWPEKGPPEPGCLADDGGEESGHRFLAP